MKTAIKLVLIYFGFQLMCAIGVILVSVILNLIINGNFSYSADGTIVPALLSSMLLMGYYLWRQGYISSDRRVWSPISNTYLFLSVAVCLTSIVILDYVMSLLPWLPNLMEITFDLLQANWLGIIGIAVLGPILEELLFRGAITRVLLKKYNPRKAIILSALVFGIFHINPAQVVVATLIGLLLGWIYYKTASLIPCILIHIINNSLSVYSGLNYPDADYLRDLFPASSHYYLVLIAAVALFVALILLMKRTTVSFPWKEDAPKEVEPINIEN